MGCNVCKSDTGTELKTEVNTNKPETQQVLVVKETIIGELSKALNDLGFPKHTFIKDTEHEVTYDRLQQKWTARDQKILLTQGILQPINVEKLKEANIYLKELKQNQKSGAKITIDENMIFQCALQQNEVFPKLSVSTIENEDERQELLLEPDSVCIFRSWNLGEQMLNFERIVEFVDKISQSMPHLKIQLVGVCRGTKDQRSSYDSSVKSNNWQIHQHIFLDQDQPEDEAWILDVDYDKGDVDRSNILSALLIMNGKLVWKKYANEWSFASDADEVQEELEQILRSQNTNNEEATTQQNQEKSAITSDTYKQLRNTFKQYPVVFKDEKYSRNLKFLITKRVIYQDGSKSQTIIRKPQISISSSPKTKQSSNKLASTLDNILPTPATCWNKQLLIKRIQEILVEFNIDVLAVLEISIKVKSTGQGFVIEKKPWEESTIVPRYPNTSYIAQIKPYIQAREQILNKLNDELKSEQDTLKKAILQKSFDFFRAIPGITTVLGTQYGPIKFCERRRPPYEELSVAKTLGFDLVRQDDKILIIYLIDYENDDSVSIMKDLINLKKSNPDYNQMLQFVALGHIRAESWTKLFQAFVEKIQITQEILSDVVETWFPVEDKVSSLSFLAVLGKIYGLQLERKDIMIVDQNNEIIMIDSSRKATNLIVDLFGGYKRPQIQPQSEARQDQWKTFKQWSRTVDVNDLNTKSSALNDLNSEEIICEQKVLKSWNIVGGKSTYLKSYEAPVFNQKVKLTNELQHLKSSLNVD